MVNFRSSQDLYKIITYFTLTIGFPCLAPRMALAYPEYAARYNVNSCTACHFSPAGGGPRNQYGKLFGAHGFKINPWLSQDYISADFRALYYSPDNKESKGGIAIMSGSFAGHAHLDEQKRIFLMLEHNIAGLSAAPFGNAYALFDISPEKRPGFFDSLLIGRFRIPFGLMTDEHRTYTRIQTATEWFTFETGLMLSGSPTKNLHYDFALLNGDRAGGQSFATAGANHWGSLLNIRWMPGPFILGSSANLSNFENAGQGPASREAISFYSVISLGRWTNSQIPMNLKLEYVTAKGRNSGLGRGFVSDAAYAQALENESSQGLLTWVDYQIAENLTLIYKYDFLIPDKNFPADRYERHGAGFRWNIGPNTILQTRAEWARATPPSEKNASATGGQNAIFALLQLSL